MDLKNYKLKDFLRDKSFQNWVHRRNARDVFFWETWIREHPEKQALAEEAAQIVRGLQTSEHQFTYSEIHSFWEELEEKLKTPRHKEAEQQIRLQARTVRYTFFKVAAVVVLLLLAGGVWLYREQHKMLTYTTTYGKTQEVDLPDGSKVTLNGNSQLHYPSHWEKQGPREVWLQGEAFFEVQEIIAQQPTTAAALPTEPSEFVKFIVHTSHLDIEVIGTSFNVSDRQEATTVVLESGKVKLQGDWLPSQAAEAMIMQPGDLVEASKNQKKWNKKVVNPADYSSWLHNKLIFDNTPIAEIARKLEDRYGLQIVVSDQAMWENRFTGSAPADRIDILYKALAASFGWEAEQKEEKIYLYQK